MSFGEIALQLPKAFDMLSVTSSPVFCRIFAIENVGREILDDNQSILRENRRQSGTVHVRHVTGKRRDWGHHRCVRAIGAITRGQWQQLRRKQQARQNQQRKSSSHTTRDFHRLLNPAGSISPAGRRHRAIASSGMTMPDVSNGNLGSNRSALVRLKSRKVDIAHSTPPRDTEFFVPRWQNNAASHQISGFTSTAEPPSFLAFWA